MYGALAFLIAGWTGWRLASRRLFTEDPALRLVAAMVLAAAALLLPIHVLGTLELLGVPVRLVGPPSLAIALALAAAALVFTRRDPPRAAPVSSAVEAPKGVPGLVPAALSLAGAYGIAVADLLSSFPRGSDALNYHFLVALRWYQENTLRISPHEPWPTSLPGNAEIPMLFAIDTRWEWLLAGSQWVGIAICFLSVGWLTEHLWRSRPTARLAGLLALSLPMVYYQVFTGYIDVWSSAFLLAGAVLYLEFRETAGRRAPGNPNWALLATAFLAWGIAIGAKPTAWFYAGAACGLAALDTARTGGLRSWRPAVVVATVSALVLPSGYWFLRAFSCTGNPFYPMKIWVGDWVLFEGFRPSTINSPDYGLNFVRSSWEWLVYPWTEWKRAGGYLDLAYSPGSGVGAAFATFVPLGLIYAGICAWRGADSRSSIIRFWSLALLGGVLAWFTIFHQTPRFGLPILLLMLPLAGGLLKRMVEERPRLFGALYATAIALTSIALAFEPAYRIAQRTVNSEWARSAVYEYPEILDRLPPGSVVVNHSQEYANHYALAGRGLKNRVIAFFELPSPLTVEFLRNRQADYVVDVFEIPKASAAAFRPNPPVCGLTIFAEADLYSGNPATVRRWIIWSVPDAGAWPDCRSGSEN